ncbi:hypothetical protein VTI28DRAFT_9142 [Corynascus sepedonium]
MCSLAIFATSSSSSNLAGLLPKGETCFRVLGCSVLTTWKATYLCEQDFKLTGSPRFVRAQRLHDRSLWCNNCAQPNLEGCEASIILRKDPSHLQLEFALSDKTQYQTHFTNEAETISLKNKPTRSR